MTLPGHRPVLALLAAAIFGCASPGPPPAVTPSPPPDAAYAPEVLPSPDATQAPPAPRELRAAWVASVANIDWPSRKGLPVERQQEEIRRIVARAAELNLNALIVQVRPGADALYASELEPWSEYLTGEQGRAPEPFYDPLALWIEEAHRRGIEIHAWFNPYRARHPNATTPEAPTHIARTHPALVKRYGAYLWLDPGEAASAQRTLDVILDVVRRYDIDGVHIDDYFYPYPEKNGSDPNAPEIDFPDAPSWQAYRATGGTLARADWRRRNVDQLIERLHAGVHREKYWVRFGISPFGLGRPDRRAPGIAGFSQYDKLYADVELWMARCWLDYLAPQLYWPIDQAPQAFGVLLDGWIRENTCGRHLWPGLFTSRIDHTEKSWKPAEILAQVDQVRARRVARGQVHFSMVALADNRAGIADELRSTRYATPALIPTSPWLDVTTPAEPLVVPAPASASGLRAWTLAPQPGTNVARFAVWARHGESWQFHVLPATGQRIEFATRQASGALDRVVVSTVDRLGNESARVVVVPE